MLTKRSDILFHENKHLSFLKDNVGECALFLKRDDNSFPLNEPCNITLVGNGVRNTLIGGTGSGAVNVRHKESIEEAFIAEGFSILNQDWLDAYDEYKKSQLKPFVKQTKKEAHKAHTLSAVYAMGKEPLEANFSYPIKGDKEVAIYVLSRSGGEGSDRRIEKGDVLLTDSEVKDILYLNKEYKKFLLVLNVPGVIDLEPVLEAKNILYLSQLGSLTAEVLVDIVLGKINPSGKLTTTWARLKDYPYINTPIDQDECLYKEGIYVGYRYFASKGIEPLFPLGFGLSYSSFLYEFIDANVNGDTINVKVKVTNGSDYPGKEVIQVYLSHDGNLRAKYNLVAFSKTDVINPYKSEVVYLSFKLGDFPIYDSEREAYILEGGHYLISVGNSVSSLTPLIDLSLKGEVVVKKTKNAFAKPVFDDLKIDVRVPYDDKQVKHFDINVDSICTKIVDYSPRKQCEIPEFINKLSLTDLAHLSMGDYKKGLTGLIGQSCSLIVGGAGETTLKVKGFDNVLSMVDGPAGLRMKLEYIVNSKGVHPTTSDNLWEQIKPFIPGFITKLADPNRNKKKKGSVVIQSATALPIATAIAQSFNPEFALNCGRLVKEEMELYNADIWLAPAMNIHRSILCGRNFEYYSEDPLVSALFASSIVNGVQENASKVCCLKHFAANNQESNRLNNNSVLSEKSLREIYLSGFEKAISLSHPKTMMSSYNLINGIHASEHHGLLVDILRHEWGYDGLMMSDWVVTGRKCNSKSKYPSNIASHNIKNGNNLCMPGSKKDVRNIKRAIESNYLSIEELKENASLIYNFINSIKKNNCVT